MPVSADPYSQIQVPKLATLGEIAEARELRADRQEARELSRLQRDLTLAKIEEERADRQALTDAYRQFMTEDGPDIPSMIRHLQQAGRHGAASKLQADYAAQRENALKAHDAELGLRIKRNNYIAQLIQGVEDDETLALALPSVEAFDPAIAELLKGPFDPAKRDLVLSRGRAVTEQDARRKEALAAQKDAEAQWFNLASLADSPEEWDKAWEFGAFSGLTTKLRAMGFTPEFSPEHQQKAADAALTPEKRAELAGQKETREISRGNLEVARGQLQVAQGNLAVRRQEAAGTGTLSAADKKLVDAIMKSPQIYAGLTPTVKSRLAVPLAEAGFNFAGDANSGKPPTGLQMRAMNFFNRAKQAADELEAVEADIAKMGLAGQARMNYLPNFVQSQAGQQYIAAQRAFTEARLRKDSGAAIPDSEFENDRKTYFVQPGDSAETIAQKKRQRSAVLASLGYEAGPALQGFYGDDAAGLLDRYKADMRGEQPSPPASTGGGPVRVQGKDGKTYEFPSQQAADNFKKAGG